MKEIPHVQKREYGCNFYCIANLLNLPADEVERQLDLIEKYPDSGMNEFYENEILRKHEPKLYFGTIFRIWLYDNSYLNNEMLLGYNRYNTIKNGFEVYLLTIQLGDHHRILLLRNINIDEYYLINPTQKQPLICNAHDIITNYKIRSVSLLVDQCNRDTAKIYQAHELAHLI